MGLKDKYNWYFNRLLLMSPAEIIYRSKSSFKSKLEKIFLKDFAPSIALSDKKISWYFEKQEKDRIYSFLKENHLQDETKPERLMRHEFSFFALHNQGAGDKIDWHRDYKNNRQAPLLYCHDINYREFKEVGDIKYIWEINRHQHLINLAKAHFLKGREGYKEEVISQISDWIRANPYKKGVNWESTLEIGIRLIAWSWIWFFLGDLNQEFQTSWLQSIYKQCDCISRNFSRYSSANNHLIGEAAGLFIASIVWPFAEVSEKWQEKSYSILIAEMEKQNHEDGVNKEQAVSYQQFVLDFFILCGLLGEKNGVKFPEKYWKRIEQMLVFIASLMDINGNVPSIGDADDGWAVILSDEEGFSPYLSLLAAGALLFRRGDFKGKARALDEKTLWLFGIRGLDEFNELKSKEFCSEKSFREGGYFILSSSENTDKEIKCVFDCGPLGYLSLAAHGHSDALSFTLNIGGTPFIIDPGTYAYHTKQNWREYFKGTSAHSTVRVDRVDQSVSVGSFMWLKKAEAKLLKYEFHKDRILVIGEHNGYMRLEDPVLHQREVFFDTQKKTIRITDRIFAKGEHFIEQFFHFSQNCQVRGAGSNTWRIENNKKSLIIRSDEKLQSQALSGSEEPILGWSSSRFDVKIKTCTLVSSCECVGEKEFTTYITINH